MNYLNNVTIFADEESRCISPENLTGIPAVPAMHLEFWDQAGKEMAVSAYQQARRLLLPT